MRKGLLAGILICLFSLNFCVSASETQSVIPYPTDDEYKGVISLPSDDYLVGDLVYVDVKLKPRSNVYGYEFALKYDDEYLEYTEVDCGKNISDYRTVEQEGKGELMFAFSLIGDQSIENADKLCTVSFKAKENGTASITLKSIKIVFDDMSYFADSDTEPSAYVKIRTKKTQSHGGGGGGGGGGGRGGRFSVSGGGTTSVGAPVLPKPVIEQEPITVPEVKESFSDVSEEHWAAGAIEAMRESGILSGYEDGSFRPEAYVTRAEFIKIAASFFKLEAQSVDVKFNDVALEDWYYSYVTSAAGAGIINGDGTGNFRPNDNISREEAAAILARCCNRANISLENVRLNINFVDEASISDFAVGYVDALYVAGIVSGDEDGYFRPLHNMTRAETAKIVYEISSLSEKTEGGSNEQI